MSSGSSWQFEALNYLYLVPTVIPCPFRHTAFSQSREHLHNTSSLGTQTVPCPMQHRAMSVQTGSLYSLVVLRYVPYEENNPRPNDLMSMIVRESHSGTST